MLVTSRMPPLHLGDRVVHQIGLPYHWGVNGLATGDSANDLFGIVLDPNVHIQESKTATCDIRPAEGPVDPPCSSWSSPTAPGRHRGRGA